MMSNPTLVLKAILYLITEAKDLNKPNRFYLMQSYSKLHVFKMNLVRIELTASHEVKGIIQLIN